MYINPVADGVGMHHLGSGGRRTNQAKEHGDKADDEQLWQHKATLEHGTLR
jgi:hypothetical protein